MKKGLIIGKRQFVLAGLIAVLGVAVWANMHLAAKGGGLDISAELTSSKYLGEAQFVDNRSVSDTESSKAVSAEVADSALAKGRQDRDEKRADELERLEEAINTAKDKSADVSEAAAQMAALTKRADDEKAIEEILLAKKFNAFAVVGEKDVTVMVDAGELLSNQTMQIKDAVMGVCGVSPENIKIITVE